MINWLAGINLPDWTGWVEIICLTAIFYYLLFFFRGTRGAPALTGFVMLFVAMLVITRLFHLDTLNWLLGRFSVYLSIAFLVIFQPEIRRVLAEIGKQHFFNVGAVEQDMIDDIIETVTILAQRKIGALIAIERAIGIRSIQETGVTIDAEISPELLASIFFPYTPLHDGGVIISDGKIIAARCVFPLSMREEFSRMLGTRHRAAVGLTEETDAIVIVVSEETGGISLSREGRLLQSLDPDHLHRILTEVLARKHSSQRFWIRLRSIWTPAPAKPNPEKRHAPSADKDQA